MGYGTREDMARLTKLYGFGHPFISSEDTPSQILQKGLEFGREEKAKKAVDEIVRDIEDRSGLGFWTISSMSSQEIREKWKTIILKAGE